jgi:UDP-2,3-diacylglucosamine pyrophosphatase LpxH
MVTYLKNDIQNFVGALHIADVHVRLLKRHDEYIKLFNEFYNVVDKTPKETVICVVGDLLHNKIDLSPECLQIASDFLKNLADRRPTILVAGNHDAILANKNRLDSLSPIVTSLNHQNLFYLKNSGLYIIGDILFNNMSVFDEPDKFIKASEIPSIYRNKTRHLIGLYHGPVNGSVTDVGYVATSNNITSEFFDGHDMVFLGDIHRAQTLYIEKEIEENVAKKYIETGDWEIVK